MTETHSNIQNSEKIATLSKVADSHEQTLQEIHKQLQTIIGFMQKLVEVEDKRQSPI